jgi:PKD repeat protein
MIKNIVPAATALVALAAAGVAQTGNQVLIPPHNNIYNGFSRGYGFVAGGDFFIQDLELPPDAMQAGDTAGVFVRVNGVNVMASIGNAGAVMTPAGGPIQVFTGDVVDVVGNWSPAAPGNFTAHNSYGLTAPFASSIEGVATTLDRVGVQWDIGDPVGGPTGAYLNPTTGSIGRVWMYTTPPAGIFASFTATPSTGASPLSVSFTDTTFTDDPGGVVAWDWDLDGDGVSDSALQNPTFTYPSCGSYDVTLTSTDLLNGSSTTTVVGAVQVDNVVASFTVAEITSGIWQFTDTSAPTPISWAWDFDGDGIVDDTAQNPVYVQAVPSPFLSLPTCELTVAGVGGCFSDTIVEAVNAVGAGIAQGPIAGGNGTAATPAVGVYFDIQVPGEGVNITGLQTAVYTYGGPMDVEVYITNGTHVGNEGVAANWTLAGTGSGTAAGGGPVANPELVTITLNDSFYLPTGDYGVALYHINPAGALMNIGYTNGPAASPYGNADIVIHPNGAGCSSTSLLGGCAFSPRLWNGRIAYEKCSTSNNAAAGSYANGCANSAGVVPSMSVGALPQLGGTYQLDVDAGLAAPATAVVMVMGVSKTIYNGLPLPLDLGILGAPGCLLATDVLATDLLIAAPGPNPWTFAVANNPALMCFEFYQQAAVLDPAANAFGFVVSNATAAVVGN